MLFHSVEFIVFFLIFLAGFLFVRNEMRLAYTAIASFIFYAWWYPPYLLLLFFFSFFAYFVGIVAKRCSKIHFGFLIAFCLTPLIFFKYAGFILQNVHYLFGRSSNSPVPWHLPLGISFITFTVLAYLIDIRRSKFIPEKNWIRVSLYLSFFPHLIAGPIMRPHELFPQFAHLKIKKSLVKIGILLFAVGMIKKNVFADSLAAYVDWAYSPDAPLNFAYGLLAFYAFAGQIYFDFSGYTDMALGIAFLLGVRLPLNFNRPYLSVSIREFWRRWHITLSRWLRDYLYIPMGGSRGRESHTFLTLMATMLLGGLWHGASWTFIVWGGYHGCLLCVENFLKRRTVFRFPSWIHQVMTFHLVCLGWILFRSGNWGQLIYFVKHCLIPGNIMDVLTSHFYQVLLLIVMIILHRWDRVSFFCWLAKHQKSSFVYAIALVMIFVSLIFSIGNPSAFIYFDF